MAVPSSSKIRVGITALLYAAQLRNRAPARDDACVLTVDYGWFKWNALSTASDDGVSVIAVGDITTGRWIATTAVTQEGIQDSAGHFNSDTVEAALAALASGVGVTGTMPVHKVRGASTADVSDLEAFDVDGAAADGLTYVEDDRILLQAQSTGSENGIYRVGAVAAGVAALTREPDWAAAAVIPAGSLISVDAGDLYAGDLRQLTNVGAVTVDTTAPTFKSTQVRKLSATVGEADLTDADGEETVALVTLPAGAHLLATYAHTYTPFTGGTIADFTVDVGTAGDPDGIVVGADIFAAAVEGQPADWPPGAQASRYFPSATVINGVFKCGSDDVADATAGAVTIDFLYTEGV